MTFDEEMHLQKEKITLLQKKWVGGFIHLTLVSNSKHD